MTTAVSTTRRVCFDLSCSLRYPQFHPWISTPAQARDCVPDGPCNFAGATAYVSSKKRYVDFIDAQALLDCLLTADELITFNGRIYDLIALEKILGEEALKPIWCKPHHDLGGWSRWELRASVAEIRFCHRGSQGAIS